MSIIQGTSKAAGGGYTIDQSILFNDDDSAYLTRTPGSASSHTTFTFSMWVKRCRTGSMRLFSTALGTSNKEDEIYFESNDRLQWQSYNGGFSYGFRLLSQAVYRDFSAWMHIVAVLDSTNGTAADRQRLYVNGERITAFDAEVQASASYASSINNTQAHYFSRYYASAVDLYDGYMAEVYFIDNQALDPSSFGEVDSDTGQWVPKQFAGAYGTNGYYITGENSADLGADYSGNGNNFTSSGLTSADQVSDSPTDDAENNIGNYAVLSPIDKSSVFTTSNGNTRVVVSGGTGGDIIRSTEAFSSGKFAAQFTITDKGAGDNVDVGVVGVTEKVVGTSGSSGIGQLATGYSYRPDGLKMNNGSATSYGATYTNADRIECEFDRDAGTITFFKNGTSQGTAFTGVTSGTFAFAVGFAASVGRNIDVTVNFGATAFTSYTPTTGFKRLCTANLPDPTIADPTDHFQTVLDTGANIKTTAEALYTDQLVWIKDRNNLNNHQLIDSVRGTSAVLQSNTTSAETTYSAPSGNSVGWVWKANGTGSSNTDGSITSTVSADTTSGFSIATFTGNGTQGATVGHGLGVAPKMIIVKARITAGTDYGWWVYHAAVASDAETDHLILNTSAAVVDDHNSWDDTAPTSAVFSIGGSGGGGAGNFNITGDTLVAYCFAEVEGYSKFGSYTGNGSTDGPFVYCGFRPAYIMIKRVSGAVPGSWSIWDTARMTGNGTGISDQELTADTAAAEPVSTLLIDILSNGFKPRTAIQAVNASATPLIYMAFAESPFKYANAR